MRFAERHRPAHLDAETGACLRVPEARRSSGGWLIPLELPFAGSRVFLFGSARLRLQDPPPPAGETLLTLDAGWACRPARRFALGEHDIEVAERREEALPAALGDWRPVLGEGFSGEAEYAVRFECDADTARRATLLGLGEVRYACEAFLNGERLGSRLWPPFAFPVAGKLRAGANELRVVVANTMANQYLTSMALERWQPNQLGPYHPMALRFEPDSLPSGLFGPVRLRAGRHAP